MRLLPFVGIGPRRFSNLFALQDPAGNKINRKSRTGEVLARERTGAAPMLQERLASFVDREQAALGEMASIREVLEQGPQRRTARHGATAGRRTGRRRKPDAKR